MQLPPVAVVSTTSFPHYTIAKCRFVTLQRPPIPLTFPARHRQHIRRPTCLSSAEAQGNPDRHLLESCTNGTNPNTALWGKSLSIYVVHAHCLILSISDHVVTPDQVITCIINTAICLRIGAPFHAGHQKRSQINIHLTEIWVNYHSLPSQIQYQPNICG